MCVCVCVCVCVGSIFFFFVEKEHPFFLLAGSWLSSERLFLLTSTCTHSSLLSVCERDRDRDREFFLLDTYFGGCNKTDLQNSDFVGVCARAHTHTHTPSRYKKAVREGVSFLSSTLPLGGHLSPGIMYFRESLLEEGGIFHLQTDFFVSQA